MAMDFLIGILLLLLAVLFCGPLWIAGIVLLWLGQKLLTLGHQLHFWLQKAALKIVKGAE